MDTNERLRRAWAEQAAIHQLTEHAAKPRPPKRARTMDPYNDARDMTHFEAFKAHKMHALLSVRKRGAYDEYLVTHPREKPKPVPAVTTIIRAAMPSFSVDNARRIVENDRREKARKSGGRFPKRLVPKYQPDVPKGCVIAGTGAYGGSKVHEQMEMLFRHHSRVLEALYDEDMHGLDPRTHALIMTLKAHLDLRVVAVEFPVFCPWGALRIDALAVDSRGRLVVIDYKTCGSIEDFIQHDGSAVHPPFSDIISSASMYSRSIFQVLMGEMMLRRTYGVTHVRHMVLAVSIKGVQPYHLSDAVWASKRDAFYEDMEQRVPRLMQNYRKAQRAKRSRGK